MKRFLCIQALVVGAVTLSSAVQSAPLSSPAGAQDITPHEAFATGARSASAALVRGMSYLAARAPPWTQLGNLAITHNDAIHGVIETVPEPHRKAVIEHLHNYVGNTINQWHGGVYGYKIHEVEDWGEGLDIGRGFKATGESYSAHKSLLSPSHVVQVSHPAPPPHWPFGPATL